MLNRVLWGLMGAVVMMLLATSCSSAGEGDEGGVAPAQPDFVDIEVAKVDELGAPLWLSTPTARAASTHSLEWRRIGERFASITDVSMRPDGTMYVVDAGGLFRSDGTADSWREVESVDAGRGCMQDTPIAALVPGEDTGFYVETRTGKFDYVELPTRGSVGCSLVMVDGNVWGTLDDERVFVVSPAAVDSTFREVALGGPDAAIDEGLVMFDARLSPGSTPAIQVEGIDSTGLQGAGEVWRWWIETDDVPEVLEGVSGTTDVRSVGTFETAGGGGEIMNVWGRPDVGFKTHWSGGVSKAVRPMGPEDAMLNSMWPEPRHFVGDGDPVFAFGAVTAQGVSDVDSAMWRLTGHGWTEFRGAGPGVPDDPQVVQHAAMHADQMLVTTCELVEGGCDEAETRALWLGTVLPANDL